LSAQEVAKYHVPLEGCPTELVIAVPIEFSHANTADSQQRRAAILEGLHANRARTARYSEIFLADWSSDTGFPHISVASLGSLLQSQGKISEEEWLNIREEVLESTVESRKALIESVAPKYIAGSKFDISAMRGEFAASFEETHTTIVTLSSGSGVVEGRHIEFISAVKLAYVHRCIAYVQVAVDAGHSDALRVLNGMIAKISIR
jgi:hypothetical protein